MNRRHFLSFAARGGLVCLAAGYPVFIEPSIVRVNTYRIPVPHLPPAFAGFRIVQLTDLHHGALIPLSFLRRVIDRANRIPRDLTVCTGDYVHERNATGQIDAVWPLLAGLHAPMGVFSVLGNHDYWADADRSRYWLERSGQSLHHRCAAVERGGRKLWLVGAGDYWEDHVSPDDLMRGLPETDCRIMLAHNPDTCDTNFTGRVDLTLSGHTHGGQVVVPFLGPPVLPVLNKTYSSGFKRSARGAGVFISRGIGWAVYPVRLNCFPEIAVLELHPAAAPGAAG